MSIQSGKMPRAKKPHCGPTEFRTGADGIVAVDRSVPQPTSGLVDRFDMTSSDGGRNDESAELTTVENDNGSGDDVTGT